MSNKHRAKTKTTGLRNPLQTQKQTTRQLSRTQYGTFHTIDGFSNPLARLGAGTPNLLESTHYISSRITNDIQQLNTLYREHWLVNKIINSIPEDMLKNWYSLKSQLQPDSLKKFARLERTTKLRTRILEGLEWGRLYGGAAGVIVIKGHDDILDEPLELDMIMPDSFKGLIILDRYCGITPMAELVSDVSDPDFRLPEYYLIQSEAIGIGQKVHHSRVVRFVGRELPYIDKVAEMYWGASEIEHIFDELKKRDNTSWNIAMLIFKANLRVFKLKGMEEIGLMDSQALNELYTTMMTMNWMMSNQGMQIIGQEDSLENHQFSFAGLSEVLETFMMDLSGACEIPVTKLFGRSPAGMNATGESDMQNYYDHIEEQQESALRPVIDKLLPIMCMSIFGCVPDDLEYAFNPVRRPTEEVKKNLAKQVADSVVSAHNSGLISQKIALKELKQSSEMTGMWTNITDEDIDRADDEFGLAGEIPEGFMNGVLSPNVDINDPQTKKEQEEAIETILNGAQVQSLITIVQSVSSGDLPRSSGISMIMSAFGYPQEKAENVMGNAGINNDLVMQ